MPLYLISWIAFADEAPITIKVLKSDTESIVQIDIRPVADVAAQR